MAPKFSLQSVLDLRHGKVELLEIELGKLVSRYQETQEKLAALKEQLASLLTKLGSAQIGDINLVEINLLRQNILQTDRQIETVTRELEKLAKAVETKRAELVTAKQSEETLEILKRKRLEVYEAEQVQIEARQQDDIYIARAFRAGKQ